MTALPWNGMRGFARMSQLRLLRWEVPWGLLHTKKVALPQVSILMQRDAGGVRQNMEGRDRRRKGLGGGVMVVAHYCEKEEDGLCSFKEPSGSSPHDFSSGGPSRTSEFQDCREHCSQSPVVLRTPRPSELEEETSLHRHRCPVTKSCLLLSCSQAPT